MTDKRLTASEMQLLSSALCRAMDDRAGFAECNAPGTVERKKARELVRKYEALHVKIFGRPSGRQIEIDRMKLVPLVPITELLRRSEDRSTDD